MRNVYKTFDINRLLIQAGTTVAHSCGAGSHEHKEHKTSRNKSEKNKDMFVALSVCECCFFVCCCCSCGDRALVQFHRSICLEFAACQSAESAISVSVQNPGQDFSL